jgi:hypothetical protein
MAAAALAANYRAREAGDCQEAEKNMKKAP